MADGPEAAGPDPDLSGLVLVATAIAGRRMALAVDDVARAHTDRATIVVPRSTPPGDRLATVAVQAALIGAGSVDTGPMRTLSRSRPAVVVRYLVLEAARAAVVADEVLPRRVRSALHAAVDVTAPSSTAESLRRAGSEETVPEPPAWFGTIRARALARSDAEDAGETGGAAPSERDRAGTAKEQPVPALDEEEAEAAEASTIMKKLEVPGMKNPLTSALQKLLGMGATPSDGEHAGAVEDLPVGDRRAGRVGRAAERMRAPRALAAALRGGPPQTGRRYPEWDVARGRYRPDWCTVAEYDPRSSDDEAEIGAMAAVPDPGLRRELARLGLRHERRRRRPDGPVLDLTALVDHRIALAAGTAGDDRIYSDIARTGRDLAVLILLDCTSSIGERTVFAEQLRVAARLSAGLEQVGDRVATYGFHSRGRSGVRLLRIKDFDGRWDRGARARLAGVGPTGYTRLGAAVRHGTHVLAERGGTANLLLVVVGDGLPYDDEYLDEHAWADSRVALDETAARGIGCVGISVRGSAEPEVLARVWGGHPHRPLEDYAELVRYVRPLFAEALRTAAGRVRAAGGATGSGR